ncbi:MAG: SET domain-containing protein-lysine N-methyltransferase [Ferruginibacter sp.]
MIRSCLFIERTNEKGRGVFTSEIIKAGTIIEVSPVIVMERSDRLHLDKSLLHDYIFEWDKSKDQCCMALGWIPMYNHSYKSNCEYFMDYEKDEMMIKAARKINKGEEITINYNGDWNDEKKLWFDAI